MARQDRPSDQLYIRSRKGIWGRFAKLFIRCRLPWLWLALYVFLEFGTLNLGLSETDYTAQLFAGDTSAGLVFRLVAVLIINALASHMTVFVRELVSARSTRSMRTVLFDKVLHLPMTYFQDENPRDAVYRIVQNAKVIDNTLIFFVVPIVMALYKSANIFVRIFRYDWRLSAILIAFIPLQLLMAFLFGRINYAVNERETAIRSRLTERLAELVTNIPLAKAFAREDREEAVGADLTERLYKVSIRGSWLDQLKDLTQTGINLVQAVIMVLVGTALLRNGEINTRGWVTLYLFSSLFTGAIYELIMYWNNVKTIQGSAEKVADIMEAPSENEGGDPCPALSGDIVLSEVAFSYHEEAPVLTGVSCTFPDNAVTALLGASGSGKTTLVNLLLRLYEPEGGAITAGGSDISRFALAEYRKHFAMVSQNAMFFTGTVRENVCYGQTDVAGERLEKALRGAGAWEFVQALPQGVDTELTEYGQNLSGGQRQRLAVARALLSDAHYLILDEPVAAMDAIATAELVEILRKAAEGRCLIVIAHTKAVLPLCSRAVILSEGRVEAEGSLDEVQKASAFMQAFAGEEAVHE